MSASVLYVIVHFGSVWCLWRRTALSQGDTSHLLPVKRDLHWETTFMHVGDLVCVCIHSTSWTVVALYLLDQNSSHSSMNSMVSHHAEIQTVDSSTHLSFKNRLSLCISPPIVLTYLCMFSSCELSVTLTTFQTQRVVVSPQGPLFLTFAKEKWQLKQGRVGYSFGYLTKT